jgi:hypothetical protein
MKAKIIRTAKTVGAAVKKRWKKIDPKSREGLKAVGGGAAAGAAVGGTAGLVANKVLEKKYPKSYKLMTGVRKGATVDRNKLVKVMHAEGFPGTKKLKPEVTYASLHRLYKDGRKKQMKTEIKSLKHNFRVYKDS